jgi:hypothetical protein
VLAAAGAGESEIKRGGVGPQHGRQQLKGGADLVVPVGRGLDDLGVQAGGGVVDEHPLAGHPQVDAPLHRLAEGVQGAGHGLLGQLPQVVARGQDHRVDPAPPGLLDQVEALDLAAARLGVHQQDRPVPPGPPAPRGSAGSSAT